MEVAPRSRLGGFEGWGSSWGTTESGRGSNVGEKLNRNCRSQSTVGAKFLLFFYRKSEICPYLFYPTSQFFQSLYCSADILHSISQTLSQCLDHESVHFHHITDLPAHKATLLQSYNNVQLLSQMLCEASLESFLLYFQT